MSDLNNLISLVQDGENTKAKAMFNTIMRDKLVDALDAKKIEVASTIFSKQSEADAEEV